MVGSKKMSNKSAAEMNHLEILQVRLTTLQQEHRDLDEAINAIAAAPGADPLTVKRLKKKKLHLKDEIARIEDEITPDIIA